jgi:hypothetical protein
MKTLRFIAIPILSLSFMSASAQMEAGQDTLQADSLRIFKTVSNNTHLSFNKFNNENQDTVRLRRHPSQRGFHLGFRYQPSFSEMNFRTEAGDAVEAQFEISHGWGGSINYFFSNWVGMHLELMGSRQQYNFTENERDRSVSLSYVTIPLLLSLNTNYGAPVNLNITGGPYFGLNTGARVETTGETNGTTQAEAVAIIRPLDVGAAYGAGLDFGFGRNRWIHLNIGYRGTYGLIDINDVKAEASGDQFQIIAPRARTRTNGAYVGLMFRL